MALTAKERAANAIIWIDALDDYKKGVRALERLGTFCCLGVGCKVLQIPYQGYDINPKGLAEKVGMFSETGDFSRPLNLAIETKHIAESLVQLNDWIFEYDENFTNVKATILANLESIFKPNVAALLKEHYGVS